MPYQVIVPNAGQSPAAFPPQNNENFSRLKDIINADHNFLDSSAANQGAHKQVTFINRTLPVTGFPAGTNGVLFTGTVDNVPGEAQLFYYTGLNTYQLTPPPNPVNPAPAPTKKVGFVNLLSLTQSGNILTVPLISQGTILVNYGSQATNIYTYYVFYRSTNGAIQLSEVTFNGAERPTILIDGANSNHLTIKNNVDAERNVYYWIIYETNP